MAEDLQPGQAHKLTVQKLRLWLTNHGCPVTQQTVKKQHFVDEAEDWLAVRDVTADSAASKTISQLKLFLQVKDESTPYDDNRSKSYYVDAVKKVLAKLRRSHKSRLVMVNGQSSVGSFTPVSQKRGDTRPRTRMSSSAIVSRGATKFYSPSVSSRPDQRHRSRIVSPDNEFDQPSRQRSPYAKMTRSQRTNLARSVPDMRSETRYDLDELKHDNSPYVPRRRTTEDEVNDFLNQSQFEEPSAPPEPTPQRIKSDKRRHTVAPDRGNDRDTRSRRDADLRRRRHTTTGERKVEQPDLNSSVQVESGQWVDDPKYAERKRKQQTSKRPKRVASKASWSDFFRKLTIGAIVVFAAVVTIASILNTTKFCDTYSIGYIGGNPDEKCRPCPTHAVCDGGKMRCDLTFEPTRDGLACVEHSGIGPVKDRIEESIVTMLATSNAEGCKAKDAPKHKLTLPQMREELLHSGNFEPTESEHLQFFEKAFKKVEDSISMAFRTSTVGREGEVEVNVGHTGAQLVCARSGTDTYCWTDEMRYSFSCKVLMWIESNIAAVLVTLSALLGLIQWRRVARAKKNLENEKQDVIDRLAHHLWDLKSRAQEQMPEAATDLRARHYPNGKDVVWQMVEEYIQTDDRFEVTQRSIRGVPQECWRWISYEGPDSESGGYVTELNYGPNRNQRLDDTFHERHPGSNNNSHTNGVGAPDEQLPPVPSGAPPQLPQQAAPRQMAHGDAMSFIADNPDSHEADLPQDDQRAVDPSQNKSRSCVVQ